jgi:DNA-binding transcriptional ArsR family regulator
LVLPSSRVSQHLALLRAHRLVEERREGRNHFYRLAQPFIAEWILKALPLVDIRGRLQEAEHIDAARALWSAPDANSPH